MEDPLFQLFADIPEHDPAATLHGRVMRQVIIVRYRRRVVMFALLVAASVLASTVNLAVAAFNQDLHSLVQLAISNFDGTEDYVADFAAIIAQAIPIRATAVFIFNALLGLYAWWFMRNAIRSMTTDLGLH